MADDINSHVNGMRMNPGKSGGYLESDHVSSRWEKCFLLSWSNERREKKRKEKIDDRNPFDTIELKNVSLGIAWKRRWAWRIELYDPVILKFLFSHRRFRGIVDARGWKIWSITWRKGWERRMSGRGRRSWEAFVVSEALLNVVPQYSSFLRR